MAAHARKIYVASSWRNKYQQQVVGYLRGEGHEVYDFRNPEPGNVGFAWSSIDPRWIEWTPETFIPKLKHPIAQNGFQLDKAGLDWCDTCVCVLPCGRSAHLEAGYAIGQGKLTLFLIYPEKFEPELMYLLGQFAVTSLDGLTAALSRADEMSFDPEWPGPLRDQLLTDIEVARRLGISAATVRKWRSRDTGIPFYRVGGRVVYKEEDVKAFLEACRHEPADFLAAPDGK